MAFAVNEMREFREFYRADVSTDQSHWHYNADREVKLDGTTKAVFVRYLGDPAVNNIRLYGHCRDDRPQKRVPMVVTHRWTEKGVEKSRQVNLSGPGEYEVVTAAEPGNESIELAVPTSLR
jgi:hypothetical protein